MTTETERAYDFARFWTMVEVGNSTALCWPWQAGTFRGGYGKFSLRGKAVKAHRIAYEMAHGPIAEGMIVRHVCDNPACVNPMHLAIGTSADNTKDMIERGRNPDRQGEKHPLARLKENDVKMIRWLASIGHTHADIADDFGLSRQYVGKVIRRENWRHV